MKYVIYFLALSVLMLSQWACAPEAVPMDMEQVSIIPRPISIHATGSSFLLTSDASIHVNSSDLEPTAELMANLLRRSTGFALPVLSGATPAAGDIVLILMDEAGQEDQMLGEEGYELEVTEELITVRAPGASGIWWGIQTLRQLFPARIEATTQQPGPWRIATGTIQDYPTFAYRGAMLDVARHFFSVEDVKRYIDLIAQYKLNHLHLHLSDDQGWRIEIKSWPRLATHGGSTEVGGGDGGYYTQEHYSELVQYAAARFITIVPEIDMPGHTNAALASYPELNCDGQARELYTGIEVGFSTLCTDKEVTYRFVDDVVRELSLITPGPYIHIGGDESHVTPLEDYIPFINRVQEIVTSYNKQVLGWDEIAHARLVRNATVQYWSEAENALKAVEQGAKVLMSPAAHTYLDMQYDSTSPLGLHWAAYIEVDSAYIWDPAGLVDEIGMQHILGVEAPLWSETLRKMDDIEYMAFPRITALSEVAWTPTSMREWENFRQRLGRHQDRLDVQNVDYYPSKQVPWQSTDSLWTSPALD